MKRIVLSSIFVLLFIFIGSNDILAQTLINGDINNDGILNVADIIRFKKQISSFDVPTDLRLYDINHDNKINEKDITALEECILSENVVTYSFPSFLPSSIYTGLPIVVINTPNDIVIDSKEYYVEGTYMKAYEEQDVVLYDGYVKIKGRGHSTWLHPKKPYKLKFDNKVSFFGCEKDKEWVLLANDIDATMLRNDLAFYIARTFGNFDYVPQLNFVELLLNNQYNGTYQLGEQVKIGKGRVLDGEDGFLLETDNRAYKEDDAVIFSVNHIDFPFNVKDVKIGAVEKMIADESDENYVYIRNFVQNVDNVLYAENWLDENVGYKSVMDMNSFVQWYLINEISRNNDACFFSSCYMSLKYGNGEKLRMGPLWDYDLTFGNTFYNDNEKPIGFWVKNHGWFVRLFQDPAFVTAVKQQFDVYYSHLDEIMTRIDQRAAYIETSVVANNKIWERVCNKDKDDATTKEEFHKKVSELKNWIITRLNWMKNEFDTL